MGNPEQFDKYRKKLMELTERAEGYVTALSQDTDFKNFIDDTDQDEIRHSLKVLKDNVLPIALFAKMQSGKSTTTAAFADGREITPCAKGGGGLRTSTVSVTIYNDDNIQEVLVNGVHTTPVKITLYSEQDLVQCILDVAGGNMPQGIFAACDLDNPEHCKILKKIISDNYDLENPEDRERLKEIIAADYNLNKPEHRKILKEVIDADYNLDNSEHRELLKKIIDEIRNLNNPKYYELLMDAVQLEIGIYASLPGEYPTEKLATLREAILILKFYHSNARKKLLAGEFSTIAGVQPFLKSEHWESRWGKLVEDGFDKTASQFTAEESLHVFVKEIMMPFKSDFMKKIGSEVTDAPGTMANLRDTMRALDSASRAAIIVFVLNGDRQFTEDERKQLRTLRDSGMADKVVFALNFKDRTPEVIKNTVEKEIISVLSHEGFNAPHHKHFLYYNAYIAMRVFQAEMIIQGKLDALSAEGILKDAEEMEVEGKTVEQAWKNTTMTALARVGNMSLAMQVLNAPSLPDKKVLEKIRAFSRWDEMIFSLRAHILKNRAAGVLLDLGAVPVVKAIKSMEQTLKSREDESEKALSVVEEQYNRAKKVLEDFSARADEELSKKFTDEIDKALARNYFDEVLLGSVNPAAEDAAPQVFNESGILDHVGSGIAKVVAGVANIFRSKKNQLVAVSVEEICNRIISSCYKEATEKSAKNWSKNLEDSKVYHYYVKQTITEVRSELQRIWQELKSTDDAEDNDFLDDIEPIPKNLTGAFHSDVIRRDVKFKSVDTAAGAKSEAINALTYTTSAAGAYLGGAYIYMNILPATFVIPGIGQILAVGAVLVGIITTLIFDNSDESIKKIRDGIEGELSRNLNSNSTSIQSNIIKGDPPKAQGIGIIRQFYVDSFKKKIADQKAVLDKKYNNALDYLNRSKEERERISAKAFDWRTEKIVPLREKATEIEQEIIEIFGGGAENA